MREVVSLSAENSNGTQQTKFPHCNMWNTMFEKTCAKTTQQNVKSHVFGF